VRSTFWLHFTRVALGIILFWDILALVGLVLLPTSGSVGTVSSSDISAGDPYLHRMHQELQVNDVFVAPGADFSTAQLVLFAVSHGVAFCLAVIPMLILARRLITGVITADPFTLRTVRRLRVLGVVVLAGGAVSELTEYVTARVLLDSAVSPGLRSWAQPDYHVTFWWLITGLTLLAVAEVVRRGHRLRAELDTVI
jgi:hypothetical protein